MLVRCLFGVDVSNFQEVRLIDAVVYKNWKWMLMCFSGGVFLLGFC